jgi:serine/threonine-protein kinase
MNTPGARLGSYELLAKLGAGGMGEVFRARDTRLGRDVALKVLSGPFAFDAERRARFEHEARVLASLNHPNIATLYGIEESAGTQALILELVEGPTLADRLAAQRRLGGGLSVAEALRVADQIAAALEAAHAHGIVHRDLKPANVALKQDGTVKVLDFGLAKVFASEHDGQEPQGAVVTATAGLAAIVGTPAYMSPEQLRGLPVDKRADVWAFGCVLYEMLSGEASFAGEHSSDVVAKVIEREPDFGLLPPRTPPTIARLLSRCLAKDPRRRLRDIGDARLEIADAMAEVEAGPPRAALVQTASRLKLAVLAGLGAAGALLAGAWIARVSIQPAPPAVARFSVVAPRGHERVLTAYQSIAISPQGTHLAYAANSRVYVRALDSPTAWAVAGTEDQTVGGMFFSPDGQWLAFHSGRGHEFRKVPIRGGEVLKIATADGFLGGSWGADNRIVFAQLDGIYAVPASGGEPVALILVDPKRGERAQNPVVLPNGRVLFTLVQNAQDGAITSSIAAQTPGVSDRRIVIERGTDARYLSGDLVYADERTLEVVPFDPDTLRVKGPAVPVIRQLARQPVRNGADFAVSASGALVYRESDVPTSILVWIDRSGHQETVGAPPRKYSYVRVSPDGTRIATNLEEADQEIYIWDIARRTFARFTFNPGPDYQPIWTPDASRVAFASFIGGRAGISWQRADGTGGERLASAPGADVWNPNSFTPDGTKLVFRQVSLSLDTNLWLLSLADKSARPLLATRAREFNGEISPDGRWLAYQSDESGPYEVYVRPFPNVDKERWQVSMGGGTHPMWRPDGRELFYLASGRLLGVDIESGATPSMGPARVVLASVPFPPFVTQGRSFDISPDGQRFLFKAPPVDADYDPLEDLLRYEVVLNWTQELRRLATE